ncbi:MAG TPA: ATPase, partial [Cellvibrionaceae bacterium]
MHTITDLKQIMDASIPLVVIETFEEKKAENQLLGLSVKCGSQLSRWSLTDGLVRLSFGPQLAIRESKF